MICSKSHSPFSNCFLNYDLTRINGKKTKINKNGLMAIQVPLQGGFLALPTAPYDG